MARGVNDYDDDDNRVKTAPKSPNNGQTARLVVEDDDRYEYATLECQLWTVNALQSVPATIHLQMAYDNNAVHDKNKIVLKANVVVVTADPNISGGYQGSEVGHDVITAMQSRSDISTDQAVSVWLKDSHAALAGLHSDNCSDTAEYVYHLKQINLRRGTMLKFEWKIKLHPFGTMTLGYVLLYKTDPAEFVNHISTWFIQPLINSQSVERKRQKEADCVASINMENLSKDNKRLLDTLQLMDKTRELNDLQQMVRFVEVLNAKKQKLATLKQEVFEFKQALFEIKQQQSNNIPTAVIKLEKKESKFVKNKQLNHKVDCDRGKHKIPSTVVNEMVVKKTRLEPTQDVNAMPCTSSSVENIQVDDNIFEADTQIDSIEDHNLDRSPPWFQEVIELSEERRRKRSEAIHVTSTKVVNNPDDDNNFTNENIDPIEDNTGSPLSLQQEFLTRSITMEESLPLLQSSPNNDDQQEPRKLSAFDNLWSGIA